MQTFDSVREGSLGDNVLDLGDFELALTVRLVEVGLKVGSLAQVANGSADPVAGLEELIGDVGRDVACDPESIHEQAQGWVEHTVDASHKDG